MSKSASRRSLALRSAAALGLLLSLGMTAPPAAAAVTETYYQQTYTLTCGGDPILGLLLLSAAASASAAVTESYYQKDFTLTCVGRLCGVELPKVAASSRLKITRISCMITAQAAASVGYALYQYAGNETLTNYLAPVQVDPRIAIYNQPTEILIPAEKLLTIALGANGTATEAHCSVTGRLQKSS